MTLASCRPRSGPMRALMETMTRASARIRCFVLWLAVLVPTAPVQAETADGALLLHVDLQADQIPEGRECDLLFTLWSAETGGERVAEPVHRAGWVAQSGASFVELDLDGEETPGWLETGVRCPAGVGAFEIISPRVRVSGPTLRVHR